MVATALAAAALPILAGQVNCHYTYGGETKVLTARPAASPYGEPTVQVGSYFLFRVVFQPEPKDQAAVKVYVYGDRDDGPVPIHQASYPFPVAAKADAPYGFTGLQAVYEPLRDGELQYWCRLESAP